MSIALAPVDLSAAAVGTRGTLTWSDKFQQGAPVGVRAGRPTMRLYNESGCGVQFTLGTRSDRLPAGGWIDVQLNGENGLDYLVEYVLPGQPVSLLLGTIYEPGEPVPPIPTLGNSPIGIGGTVATSNSNILKNDANSPATEFIEATPSDQASSSVSLNNDASGFLKVLSANVLRTILSVVRGNSGAGKATIQLGDAGDTSITTLYGTVGAGSAVPAATITGVLPESQVSSGYPATELAAGALPAGVTIAAAQVGTGYPGADISGTVASATSAATAAGLSGSIGASQVNPGTFPSGSFNMEAANAVGSLALLLFSGAVTGGYGHAFQMENGNDNTCASTFGIGDFTQSPFGFGTWLYDQKNNGPVFTGVSSERTVAKRGPLAQMTTAGGGNAGNRMWEGTADPGANAGEGDWWAPA